MTKYDIYVTLIFLIKMGFITMAITHIYLKVKGEENSKLDKQILYWKERFEFVFVALMAILLIYLFNPRMAKVDLIDKETKILLYLFGFVLLITAKWDIFFKESSVMKRIQKSFGEVGTR